MAEDKDFLNSFFQGKTKQTDATPLVSLMREFKSLDTFLGAEYKVFDKKGELVYTIKKEPISLPQVRQLLDELELIGKIEEEQYKKSSKKK
jgi:hypothetical protein